MISELTTRNEELEQENDKLRAECRQVSESTTANQLFFQMKAKEENLKTSEMQKQIDVKISIFF